MNLFYLICLGFIMRSLTWQRWLAPSSLSLSPHWELGYPRDGRRTEGWGCRRVTASPAPHSQGRSAGWGWGRHTAGRPLDAVWQDSCLFQDQRRGLCIPGADCWCSNVFSHALDGGSRRTRPGGNVPALKPLWT